MPRQILHYLTLALLLFLSASLGNSAPRESQSTPEGFNPGPDIITGVIGVRVILGFLRGVGTGEPEPEVARGVAPIARS